MTRIFVTAAVFMAAFSATPAQASCWSNKAICQAICGLDCCDNWNLKAPSNAAALGRFSVDDLKRELGGIETTRSNQNFVEVMNMEIQNRGAAGGAATTLSTGN